MKWLYTLVKVATDIDGNLITDTSPYWEIDSVTENGVYKISAQEEAQRALITHADMARRGDYGVYRIEDIG